MKIEQALPAAAAPVAAALQERDARQRAQGIRQPDSLMAVSPPLAELLYLLVIARQARLIVEFGTSHGCSTVFLAAAAAVTGGRVLSVDVMAQKTEWARANLTAAGLADRVELHTADGVEFAAGLPDDLDLVLVDYPLQTFLPAFDALRPRIAQGGLLLVDGGGPGYWEDGPGGPLRTRLEQDPDFAVSLQPMLREQLIAVRIGGRS